MCNCEECMSGDELLEESRAKVRADRKRLAQAAADAGQPWGFASLAQIEEEERAARVTAALDRDWWRQAP